MMATMIRTVLTGLAILTVFAITVWFQHGGPRHHHVPAAVR
jgi:hypothetical protein